MQCIILAAGKGRRLLPLTEHTPKPLVKVKGRALLDHIIDALPSAVEEIIMVTGYFEEQIREHFGQEYDGRKITYIHQEEQKGTGHALWLCKDLIKGRFLFMFADDIHGADDLAKVTSFDRGMLVLQTDTPERFGIVTKHPDGTMADFIEKPEHPPSNLASTGVFVLDQHIFEYEPTVQTNGEFYHTDMTREYAKKYPIRVVEQELWIPVGYPEDITKAEEILAKMD
jgi:NDP-sugar pyrophosphorylase family protein